MTNFRQRIGSAGREILSYFNLSGDLEPQSVTEESIRSGVSFKGSQLLVLIFAIFIASLGLNTNSIPVIIGAMLISPLMGPIIGMGLAIGIQDFALLRRSLKNILMAIAGSILASALYFLISPIYEDSSQLLARTSPTIYDVFIGLFGGAAGILSIACKNKGQVMPGVAIATSLMPPLCTVGYGLATMQAQYFFGALYLFFINTIFILFASWIGVKLMGFKKVVYQNESKARKVQNIVYFLVTATVGLSIYLTVVMINKNRFLSEASKFVTEQMVFPNTQVLNHHEYVSGNRRYINVTLIGASLPKDSLQLAMMNKLDSVGLGGTILNIHQGFSISSGQPIKKDESIDKLYTLMQAEIARQQMLIDSLKAVNTRHEAFLTEGSQLMPEIKVLFPNVKDISLAGMTINSIDNTSTDTVNMVFVHAPKGLSATDREKLADYVKVRLKRQNVKLSVNPPNIPWPSMKSDR